MDRNFEYDSANISDSPKKQSRTIWVLAYSTRLYDVVATVHLRSGRALVQRQIIHVQQASRPGLTIPILFFGPTAFRTLSTSARNDFSLSNCDGNNNIWAKLQKLLVDRDRSRVTLYNNRSSRISTRSVTWALLCRGEPSQFGFEIPCYSVPFHALTLALAVHSGWVSIAVSSAHFAERRDRVKFMNPGYWISCLLSFLY